MEKYQNASLSPKERAKDLLAKLSMEEKIAQTGCIFPMYSMMGMDSVEPSRRECPHGIGSVSTLEVRDIKSIDDVADYQKRMQTMIMEQSPHHIPAIFHMEGLCGAFLQDSTSIPSGVSRGSGWDPELEEQLGAIVSRQETAVGFTHILAPVLDVTRDPRMGRCGESYGEDPTLAAALGTAYTRGIQETRRSDGLGADSVAKHFLAFHNSLGGVHGTETQTGPRQMDEIFGRPFQAAISEAGLKGVMPCYCSFDGDIMSGSRKVLTGLLRDEMGFNGLVCSDYSAISNMYTYDMVGETPEEAGLRAMTAGMDMEWPNPFGYTDKLGEMFAGGEADIAILDTAVERILERKFAMGLFEHPFSLTGDALKETFYNDRDYALTKKAAEQSLILLKNDGVLPIRKNVKKIAVIGSRADNARILFGGYTHLTMTESFHAMKNSVAGVDENHHLIRRTDVPKYKGTDIQIDSDADFDDVIKLQKPNCRSILGQLKAGLPDVEFVYAKGYDIAGTDESGFEEALQAIASADMAILVLGGKWSSGSISTTGEGVDSTNINLPAVQEKFINLAADQGKPMVGIHLDGRPISSDAADQHLDAILEAWAPSEAGSEAIVEVLTGAVNPSGKLPVSVALTSGQIPVYYNHPNGSSTHQAMSVGFTEYVDAPHAPRYPFGYGLSYTTFAYSDLVLDRTKAAPSEPVQVSFTVKNTGTVAGTEVAQLYLSDVRASMVRPNKELAGFCRIALAPGESRRVTLEVSPTQMAFLDYDMHWIVEKGQIHVMVGASCVDLKLESDFTVTKTETIDPRARRFYAKELA